MIIWINGAFGVGKTSVSLELSNILENSIVYNPENMGLFLRENLGYKKDDYQDYELFKKINYYVIKDLAQHFKNVIVPMTITNKKIYEMIIEKLSKNIKTKHIILIGNKKTIKNRLDSRIDSTEWSYKQIERCIKAFETGITGNLIDTNDRSIKEIVEEILNLLGEENDI